MARNYERTCISIPIELANRLRTNYPYVEYSSLITQLLLYAEAAGFMDRLQEIDPDKYVALLQNHPNKDGKKQARKMSRREMAQIDDAVEEFGV